jgi:general secretion pathway protein G
MSYNGPIELSFGHGNLKSFGSMFFRKQRLVYMPDGRITTNKSIVRPRNGIRVHDAGFTLIELMIVVAIISTLAALATPMFSVYVGKIKVTLAVQDIRNLDREISDFEAENGRLPVNLGEIGQGALMDPWGNPYQYQPLSSVPPGKWRKNKFLVPINSAYDLWSMGPDGKSVSPLTAESSRDDIIKANDGSFIGPASAY